jgi:hypothetical protein
LIRLRARLQRDKGEAGVSQQILTDSARDKLNLDIFWLKDESLEDSANLPLHCHPEFPASLDTLKVSVPPAVKLAPCQR